MKGFKNWNFDDVVQFLSQNSFVFTQAPGTSHHYYSGFIDNEEKLVQVPYHAGKSISPGNLRYTIIVHSGIPEECWMEYAKLPPQKRKKYSYLTYKNKN